MTTAKAPKRAKTTKSGQKTSASKPKKKRSTSAERKAAAAAKKAIAKATKKALAAGRAEMKRDKQKAKAQRQKAKKTAIVTTQAVEFPPNYPIIPCSDELVGREITARVNCKPHVSKRTGKVTQRCDRQRVRVVGCATPSVERPRTKQLYTTQVGQRFNVPDREINRDLRRSARDRGSRGEVAPMPGAMSFAPGSAFAGMELMPCDVVSQRALAGLPVPPEAYEAYDACPSVGEQMGVMGGDTSFDPAKFNHHGGHHAHGDPLGVYLPPLKEWPIDRAEKRAYNRIIRVWQHPSLGWKFIVYPNRTGAVAAGYKSVLFNGADIPAQMRAWYATVTPQDVHRFATDVRIGQSFYDPNAALKFNRAPVQRVPGATLLPRTGDPLMGQRVSGDGYSGEVRARSVAYDGRGPAHIVGGHVLPRSRVAGAVRREEKRVRHQEFVQQFGGGYLEEPRRQIPAPPRFAERFGAGYAEDLRPRFALPAPVASEQELAQAFVQGLGGELPASVAAPRAPKAPKAPRPAPAPRAPKAPKAPRVAALAPAPMPAPMPMSSGRVSDDEVMAMFSQSLGDLAPKSNRRHRHAGFRW